MSLSYTKSIYGGVSSLAPSNVTVTADEATNSQHHVLFVATQNGKQVIKASSKLRFNPSTGAVEAAGDIEGLIGS